MNHSHFTFSSPISSHGNPGPFAGNTGHDTLGPDLHLPTGEDLSVFDPNVPQLVLSPLFVDNLAKDFGLTTVQRGQLHTCAQVCPFCPRLKHQVKTHSLSYSLGL